MLNKDLILREELAMERTRMAQYRTFLSFIRTALYFPVAGISLHNALAISYGIYLQWAGILTGFIIATVGIIFYFRASKKIAEMFRNIGNYPIPEQD